MRSLLSWVLAAFVVCACVGGFFYFNRIDEKLRVHLQNALSQRYPQLTISIESARLDKGRSIELRGLSLVRPADPGLHNRETLLFCKAVELQCNPTVEQLLKGDVTIRHATLRGLSIKPTRESDGSWNLTDLVPTGALAESLPTVTIEDAHVELTDHQSTRGGRLSITNLQCTLTPEKNEKTTDSNLAIRGSFHNAHTGTVNVRGWFSPRSHDWGINGTATDLRITSELLLALPVAGEVQNRWADGLRLHTQLSFNAEFHRKTDAVPRFAVQGAIVEGRYFGPQLGADAITEITAPAFRIDNNGWNVTDLRGSYRAANVHMATVQNTYHNNRLDITKGHVDDLTITRELIAVLPTNLQDQWNKYQMLGVVDADFQAVLNSGRWWWESSVQCKNVSLVAQAFPYPLVRAHGTVHFRQHEKLDVDLWAAAGHNSAKTPIHIEAHIVQPGPDFQGTINVHSDEWHPIDSRLSSATKLEVQETLDLLQARGEFRFDTRLLRDESTGQRIAKDIAIEVRNGSVQHRDFPYPLRKVQGTIHAQEEQWSFSRFSGHNDSCNVTCSGQWRPDIRELRLGFEASDIPCDAELRESLPDGPKHVWKSLRPTGTIDHATMTVLHRPGMTRPEVGLVITQAHRPEDPDRPSLVVQPMWFPYHMNQVTGSVIYDKDGTFQLRDLQAKHGRTVNITAQGDGHFHDDGSWNVRFNRLTANGLDTSPEFIDALPNSLGTALTQLRFQGKLSVDVRHLEFMGNSDPSRPIDANWSMLVDVDNGQFATAGQQIEKIFGQLSIGGRLQNNEWLNTGRVAFDSLFCKGLHISNLDGPWRMDPQRLNFGAEANDEATSEAPPQPLTARLLGGTARANGTIHLTGANAFAVETVANDLVLAEVARDLSLPTQITGRGFAQLLVTGDARGPHTLGGQGNVRLREANIARLPAIISLSNALRLRNPPPDVFSSSDVEFEVQGRDLKVNRLDLRGEGLTLKGQGWVSLDRRLDLAFYTIVGGEHRWMPASLPLVGKLSQQWLQILVRGTIDAPIWERHIMPGLNDTLRQLFPEQARAFNGRGTAKQR